MNTIIQFLYLLIKSFYILQNDYLKIFKAKSSNIHIIIME